MSHRKQPPRWMDRFLEWYCKPELLEEIQGDICELFDKRLASLGYTKASWYYAWDIIRSFRLSTIKHIKPVYHSLLISPAMLNNYLKVTLRVLWKHPLYTLINISGLAISLTVSILILLWVQSEIKVDRFHQHADRIGHLYMGFFDSNKNLDPWETISFPLAKAAKEQIPEVEDIAIMHYGIKGIWTHEEHIFSSRGIVTYFNTFDIFTFPIIYGNLSQAKKNPGAVILSEDLATKLFGERNLKEAIGKTVTLDEEHPFTVEAIFEDIPKHSTIQFDFAFSFSPEDEESSPWGTHYLQAYPLLREGADIEEVERKITDIYKNSEAYDEGEFVIYHPLSAEYLYSRFDNQGNAEGGRIDYVRIFLFAAIFLLFIACINFINMAIARTSTRLKEVGVRKAVGAKRAYVIVQFMFEAALISTAAIVLSFFLVEAILPTIELWTGKSLSIAYGSAIFWLSAPGLILLTTILAGFYPAFVLSSYQVHHALSKKAYTIQGNFNLRKGLVILQFTLAMLLMVGALVVKLQMDYVKHKNLGLETENVVYLSMDEEIKESYTSLKSELLNMPGVAHVTNCSTNPLHVQGKTNGVAWEGKTDEQNHIHFDIILTDNDFLEVFDMPLASGRFLKEGIRTDSASVLLNQKAVEVMGLSYPVEGTSLEFWGDEVQVVGVVEDFHTNSLYTEIAPVLIGLDKGYNRTLFVKTKKGATKGALSSIQKVYSNMFPNKVFEYEFLDDDFAKRYKSEQLTSSLAGYFAAISIFISCLGLLGLVTFMANRKTREIGIRKVLGATVSNIVGLLSLGFLQLVLLAIFIAIPISWYLMDQWLQKFAYHIDMPWWIFALSGGIVLCIAILTVSIQSIRAAQSNPVQSLKYE